MAVARARGCRTGNTLKRGIRMQIGLGAGRGAREAGNTSAARTSAGQRGQTLVDAQPRAEAPVVVSLEREAEGALKRMMRMKMELGAGWNAKEARGAGVLETATGGQGATRAGERPRAIVTARRVATRARGRGKGIAKENRERPKGD